MSDCCLGNFPAIFSKNQFDSLWFDPTWTRTHDLQHMGYEIVISVRFVLDFCNASLCLPILQSYFITKYIINMLCPWHIIYQIKSKKIIPLYNQIEKSQKETKPYPQHNELYMTAHCPVLAQAL